MKMEITQLTDQLNTLNGKYETTNNDKNLETEITQLTNELNKLKESETANIAKIAALLEDNANSKEKIIQLLENAAKLKDTHDVKDINQKVAKEVNLGYLCDRSSLPGSYFDPQHPFAKRSICNGCGHNHHSHRDCVLYKHPFFNRDDRTHYDQSDACAIMIKVLRCLGVYW
jgi:hypothetical protein